MIVDPPTRHLYRSGVSHRALLDQVRRGRTLELIVDERLRRAQVAVLPPLRRW